LFTTADKCGIMMLHVVDKGGLTMIKRLTVFSLAAMMLLSVSAYAESDLGTLLTGALYRIVLRTDAGDQTLGSGVLFADQKLLLTAESCCEDGDLFAIGEDGEHPILAWEKANRTGIALMEMVTPATGTPLKLASLDAQGLPFIFGVNEAGDMGSAPLYQALLTLYRDQEALLFRGGEGLLPGAFVADEKGGIIGLVAAQQAEGIGMYVALDPDAIYNALTAAPDVSGFCPVTLEWEQGSLEVSWTDEERQGGEYVITFSGENNHFYTVYKVESDVRTSSVILPPGHTYHVQVQWVPEGADMVEPVWSAMTPCTLDTQPLTAYGFQQECYLTFAAPDQEGATVLPPVEKITRVMFADAALEPYFQIRNTYDVEEEISFPASVEVVAPDGQFYFVDLTYIFDPSFETDDSFILSMKDIFDSCEDFSGGALKTGEYVIRYFIGGDLAGEFPFTLEE